jgi:hypothetical protein
MMFYNKVVDYVFTFKLLFINALVPTFTNKGQLGGKKFEIILIILEGHGKMPKQNNSFVFNKAWSRENAKARKTFVLEKT